MRCIVVTTENEVLYKELPDPLIDSFREIVGGEVELVRPRGVPSYFRMLVNEDGLAMKLPFNLVGSYVYGTAEHGAPIVGDIVFVGFDSYEGEFSVLLDSEFFRFLDYLRYLAAK